jgi:hypothetical protein
MDEEAIQALEIIRQIDTENKNNFRTLLMAQPLGTATGEDIDELYAAITKSESFSA